MAELFKIDSRDLMKLQKIFRDSPKEFKQATAGILNSLAFQTRKNDIQILSSNMTIRNKKFLESSLRVETTKAVDINKQVAYAGSIERQGFTGWVEQQTGKEPVKKRAGSLASRGGNRASRMKAKARFKSGNKFYKPSQYQGKSKEKRFYFMMRVLGSRGGGAFLLDEAIQTKRGTMGKGLYELKSGKIKRLQSTENIKKPARLQWRTRSIELLSSNNQIDNIWIKQIERVFSKRL